MEKTDQIHDECIGTPVLTRRGLNNMQAKLFHAKEDRLNERSSQPLYNLEHHYFNKYICL